MRIEQCCIVYRREVEQKPPNKTSKRRGETVLKMTYLKTKEIRDLSRVDGPLSLINEEVLMAMGYRKTNKGVMLKIESADKDGGKYSFRFILSGAERKKLQKLQPPKRTRRRFGGRINQINLADTETAQQINMNMDLADAKTAQQINMYGNLARRAIKRTIRNIPKQKTSGGYAINFPLSPKGINHAATFELLALNALYDPLSLDGCDPVLKNK